MDEKKKKTDIQSQYLKKRRVANNCFGYMHISSATVDQDFECINSHSAIGLHAHEAQKQRKQFGIDQIFPCSRPQSRFKIRVFGDVGEDSVVLGIRYHLSAERETQERTVLKVKEASEGGDEGAGVLLASLLLSF